MSDDQLNDDLKSRIKEVFDHYEDNTANEGWLLLREKYPEDEKDRGIIWLWRAPALAALLLAFLGIGLWLNFHQPKKTNTVAKALKSTHKSQLKKIAVQNNNTSTDTNRQARIAVINKTNIHQQKTNTAVNNTITNKRIKIDDNNTNTTADSSAALAFVLKNKAKSLDITDSAAVVNHKTVIANQVPVIVKQDKKDEDNNIKPQASTGMQALFDREKKYTAAQKAADIKIKYNRVSFSVYAASFVNYAKGSNKQFNNGVGLTSDIKITPNLSLSTGVAIAQNSLSYNNLGTSSPLALNTAVSHNFQAETNMIQVVVPASKNLNASLVGLDVPVNLKYVFNPQNNNIYVLAGLSSGTFITETYNYSYNYNVPNVAAQQTQDDVNRKTFDNFYFAKMLNLSFGVGYPVGKNNLIIEPFVKYPLNGLGDQHILFGSGGINLKFNFDGAKSNNKEHN